ncbi:MAG: T9SS type A sorting domain-containing protein [Chitinophagaceae bacterium]|jgi:hypothetical protein|nr:T9SS type A sorting domain-containing protein [Chitinophagaceae bacterium]
MKAIFTRRVNSLILCFLASLVLTGNASAQAPIYKFQSPSLVSGTDKAVNAVYRFPNVTTGYDALVQITNMSAGIALRNIDRTIDGYGEAFQPEYRVNANTNGYIDFLITFVLTGTSTAASQPFVDVSGLDIDGDDGVAPNNLREYNRIDMGGGTYSFNTTVSHLSISQSGTAYTGTNVTGVLWGALVDTSAKEVMFTVTNTNVTSFTYRVGAFNNSSSTGTRYASLYFKKFYYAPFPLAIPSLINFEGTRNGNGIAFKWDFSTTEGLDRCLLERAVATGIYSAVADFEYTGENAFEKHTTYNDNSVSKGNYNYRLKMIGKNGEIKYSSVLAFKTGAENDSQELNVYPSVISSSFTARFNADRSEPAQLQIVDYSGRSVYSKSVVLVQGQNNISVNDFTAARGNFVIVVRKGGKIYSQKVIVQ